MAESGRPGPGRSADPGRAGRGPRGGVEHGCAEHDGEADGGASGGPDGGAAQPGGWFSDEVATFGDRLAGAREAAGLTQEELARRLGVRLSTLQAWEDDMAEPRGNRLWMLAGLLDISPGWLLTAEGEGPDAPGDAPGDGGDADLRPAAIEALAELSRLHLRADGLAQEIARVEKRLRLVLRREGRDDA